MCKKCNSIPLPSPQLAGNQFILPLAGYDTGISIPKIAIRNIDGDEILIACSACGDSHPPDELVNHSQSGDKLCDDCQCSCEQCGNVYADGDDEIAEARDGESYRRRHNVENRCNACSWECADCNDRFYGESSTNDNDEAICSHCAENYFSCESCGETVHSDNSIYIETDSCSYCERCGNRRQREIDAENEEEEEGREPEDFADEPSHISSELIREYSHKPSPRFFQAEGEFRVRTFFGLELETQKDGDTNHDNAIRSSGIATDETLYCKADGSIGDGGFEIVSHPCSFKRWMSRDWSFTEKLKGLGYDSFTEACGLHIHVSRKCITQAQLAKLLLFVKRNHTFFTGLSRRVSGEALKYEGYACLESGAIRDMIYRARYGNTHVTRYTAINLENEATIEFRLFQGTLDASHIKRTIALVYALLGFIKYASIAQLDACDFRDYLSMHGAGVVGVDMCNALCEWMDKEITIAA